MDTGFQLDLHKTSHRPDTFSTESEAVLSERGEPIGSSNKEKQVLNGDGASGDAGILRKSSQYINTATHGVSYLRLILFDYF